MKTYYFKVRYDNGDFNSFLVRGDSLDDALIDLRAHTIYGKRYSIEAVRVRAAVRVPRQ